jgi:hypothetical protein
MTEASLAVVEALSGSAILGNIRQFIIGLFVREVLRRSTAGMNERSPRQTLSAAIASDFVTLAIVGVSTRQHLDELLSSIT